MRKPGWSVVGALLALVVVGSGALAQEEQQLDAGVAAKLRAELDHQGYPRCRVAPLGLSDLRSVVSDLRPEVAERMCAAFDSGATLGGPHREVEGRQAIVSVFRCKSPALARAFFDEFRPLEVAKIESVRSGAVPGMTVEDAKISEARVEGATAAFKARKTLGTPEGPLQIRKVVLLVGEWVLEVTVTGEAKGEHVEAVAAAMVAALTPR